MTRSYQQHSADNARFLWLVIYQVVFFFLFEYTRYIFHTHPPINITLWGCLVTWLTFLLFRYLLQVTNIRAAYIKIFLSLLVLFQLERFITYKMGLLYHYDDIPFLFHVGLSVVVIFLYLAAIELLRIITKRKDAIK